LVNYKEYFPNIIPAQLPHLHAVTVFWHAQMLHFLQLLSRWPQRLRVLHVGSLLKEPAATLQSASNWLQLGLGSEHFTHVVNGNIWKANSKDTNFNCGTEIQEHGNSAMINEFRPQIDESLAWASNLLASKPVTAIEQQVYSL